MHSLKTANLSLQNKRCSRKIAQSLKNNNSANVSHSHVVVTKTFWNILYSMDVYDAHPKHANGKPKYRISLKESCKKWRVSEENTSQIH